ncbi:MAG: YbaB/EbfC family nucleoid-associated protein [Treponema sp.]|nr:YbaB/EbfC family nucleoid-associated protein [Treponema sp.]
MNPFEMMKNLGSMKEQLQQAQAKLDDISATGSSGGNMVKITMNGHFEIEDIELDPICVDNRDVPMLQDLIKAAHHAALTNLQDKIKNEMGPMFANLNIPGMS